MSPPWQVLAAVLTLSCAVLPLARGFTFHMPSFGGCPDLEAQQGLQSNIERYLGKWFVQADKDTAVLTGNGRCVTASFRDNPLHEDEYSLYLGQYNIDKDHWETIIAEATPADKSQDVGLFTVTFDVEYFGEMTGKATVLGTDYDSYSVLHGCGNLFWGICHYQCSWLMSRKQILTADQKTRFWNKTSSVLRRYEGLDPADFRHMDQADCHYS